MTQIKQDSSRFLSVVDMLELIVARDTARRTRRANNRRRYERMMRRIREKQHGHA